jgi:hypothetical protein
MVFDIVFGIGAFAFGCYTIYLRAFDPGKLGKLTVMKALWGDAAGNAIHAALYMAAPIIVGLVLLTRAAFDSRW